MNLFVNKKGKSDYDLYLRIFGLDQGKWAKKSLVSKQVIYIA